MKDYPSIPKGLLTISGNTRYNHNGEGMIYVFDKLDGSQIRIEWNKKKGFHRFGRRNGLLDGSNPVLQRAPDIFIKTYEGLHDVFVDARYTDLTIFAEFYGPNSFAGWHDVNDNQQVTIYDIDAAKNGLMPIKEYLNLVRYWPSAKLLYKGFSVTPELVESVRESTLEGMTFEGVICKSGYGATRVMTKLKSKAWLEKLKAHVKGDEELFKRLE